MRNPTPKKVRFSEREREAIMRLTDPNSPDRVTSGQLNPLILSLDMEHVTSDGETVSLHEAIPSPAPLPSADRIAIDDAIERTKVRIKAVLSRHPQRWRIRHIYFALFDEICKGMEVNYTTLATRLNISRQRLELIRDSLLKMPPMVEFIRALCANPDRITAAPDCRKYMEDD